jgi:diguanylate cyclase (GGDEF)-like protein
MTRGSVNTHTYPRLVHFTVMRRNAGDLTITTRADRFRREAFLIGIGTGIALTLLNYVFIASDDVFVQWGSPALLVALVAVWVSAYRGRHMALPKRIQQSAFLLLLLFFVANVVFKMFTRHQDNLEWGPWASNSLWNFVPIFGFGMLIFEAGWVLTISLTTCGLLLGLGVIRHLQPPSSLEVLWHYSLNTLSLAASAVMFYLNGIFRSWLEEVQQRSAQLYDQARTDALTGLPNRRALEELLRESFQSGDGFGVIIADIDHFKKVNDDHGHDQGDIVLKEVAQRFRQTLRSSDVVGRWGGEEFIVVCRHDTAYVAAMVAERLRKAILSAPIANLELTCSFGVAAQRTAEDIKSVLERGDQALYQAKAHGRNRVEISGS